MYKYICYYLEKSNTEHRFETPSNPFGGLAANCHPKHKHTAKRVQFCFLRSSVCAAWASLLIKQCWTLRGGDRPLVSICTITTQSMEWSWITVQSHFETKYYSTTTIKPFISNQKSSYISAINQTLMKLGLATSSVERQLHYLLKITSSLSTCR